MKVATLIVAAVAQLAGASIAGNQIFEKRAACDANNCARLITGTARGPATQASRRADCSSFFSTTVYTTISISTVTVTVGGPTAGTSQPVILPNNTPYTVTPTLVPVYASSSCITGTTPVATKFASVCSCWAVPRVVTTAKVPATIVVTATATTSKATFIALATGATSGTVKYLYDIPPIPDVSSSDAHTLGFTTDRSKAQKFTINSANSQLEFVGSGLLSAVNPEDDPQYIKFVTVDELILYRIYRFILNPDGSLTFYSPVFNNFVGFRNDNGLLISDTSDQNGEVVRLSGQIL